MAFCQYESAKWRIVMFEIRTLNGHLPTFAWNSAESFAFSINVQLFVSELTTMLLKTKNWKYSCASKWSLTVREWRYVLGSGQSAVFDCPIVKCYRIELSGMLFCDAMSGTHAPKVEFRGSEIAFKEDSWFLIAATCSETAFKEDYWFYALTTSYW